MKRVIVWSWARDPSLKPIEQLVSEGQLEVVLWVSMLGDKTFKTKEFSYVPAKMLDDLVRQQPVNDVFYNRSNEQLTTDVCRFQDIYSRVNYSKGRDYHDHLNLFHLYYQYFTNIMKREKVDSVIYFGAPHAGADYVLYLAAKGLGVDVTITLQSHVPNRFFCIDDIEDYGYFESCKELGEPVDVELPEGYEKKHFYHVNIKSKRKLRLHKLFEDCLRTVIPSRQPICWAGVWQNFANRWNFPRAYEKAVVHEVDMSKKFVYFPLHLQPELTTSFLGGEFSDQLLAIEKLSSILPDDWHIYVKENPSQGASQRNPLFYQRLARVPNCLYVSAQVNTYDLMRSSQFVASITGTACWEAISGGKPALVFGNIWFMSLPGVTVYKDGVTLEDIVDNSFTHDELEAAYRELMARSTPGIVATAYAVIHEEYEVDENAALLVRFLRKRLGLSAS